MMWFARVRVSFCCLYGRPAMRCQAMRQTTKPAHKSAACDGSACGTNCGKCAETWGIIHSPAANRSAADLTRTSQTMNTTYSDFAATVSSIRADLTALAFDQSKADRGVMMRAAAALAMFESDMLRKAAGPILPGELQG
jgi:hypothetical protein